MSVLKIPVAEPSLGEEELRKVVEVIKSGWISSKGRFIEEFEKSFAAYCGRKYGVATSSGTAALHLALKALGIKENDEVIVPDLVFIAVANTVSYCNAKPVFVDSHPEYWCIDPGKIKEKLTSRSKAIIAAHLYGHPCDMDGIMNVAKRHNLDVIEDAAEAHGAEYKGKKVGSFGNIACFSFYGNKIITTGEGGMCLTDDKNLEENLRILKDHGMNLNKKYWHDVIGFNYRMTNLQAGVGVAQLEKLDEFVEKKEQIARWYEEELKRLEEKRQVKLHPKMPWAKCVYWLYSILIEDKTGVDRDELIKELERKGIETRPLFYPIHTMPPYNINNERFPIAEKLSRRGISLPSSVSLNKEQVKHIATEISKSL